MKDVFAGVIVLFLVLAALIPKSEQQTSKPYHRESPVINLPLQLRQKNWSNEPENGSCVHASWIMLLRWQGKPELANAWRRKYAGGEKWQTFETKLKANKVPYASTHGRNDVSFLEWAIRTRRGCMVTVMDGHHMVCLVELTDTKAGILDNNDITKIHWMKRSEFITIWTTSNSWAGTPMYSPTPPRPR